MIKIIRSLGLHHSNQTPCGQPISMSEAHAIMELQKRKKITQSDLTQLLSLEKSTVSRLIQQLKKKNWLIYETDPKDHRVKILKLSEGGLKVAQQLESSRKEKFDRILSKIPPGKQQDVIVAMELLTQAISNESNEN